MKKKTIALFFTCILAMLALCGCGEKDAEQTSLESSETTTEVAESTSVPADVVAKTGDYLLSLADDLSAGEGGDWIMMALARSDKEIPDGLFDAYYAMFEQMLTENGGVVSETKYTEYARSALMLTAIGRDPRNVGGYDLFVPLADYEKVTTQGINGPIWTLIALNSGGYTLPVNDTAVTSATADMYLQFILDSQLESGAFSLSGDAEDTDLTAMALQALSFYDDRAEVSAAIEKALVWLSSIQNEDGSFSTWGESTAESCAQVLVALTALGIDVNDDRFVKNGCTVFDGLMRFALDDGSFSHVAGSDTDDMIATEQSFYAAVSLDRTENGQSFLYDMMN